MVAGAKWRSMLRRFVGWPLLTLLAITAFMLGYAGFAARFGGELSIADLTYLSLQLFTLESGHLAGPALPVTLEIARFLAPAVAAYALGRALVRVFRHEIEHWRLRRRKGHIVVVGLGWLGLALVERLLQQNRPVVAVTLALDDEAIASVRRSRVPVVVGDARDPDVLRDARVGRADHIVVLAGADETNAEVALNVSAIFREHGDGSLRCLAHIRDPHLCQMLRTETLAGEKSDGFRLEFFNVAEEAAGIMLDEHAAFLEVDLPARIGVIGDSDMAAAVISEAIRTRRLYASTPLDVVLAGPEEMLRRLDARYPHLRHNAEIEVVSGLSGSLESEAIEKLSTCDAVFVCLDEDVVAIAVTLDVAERIGSVPVVVALGEWSGLAHMLSTYPGTAGTVHPFLVFERVLEADMLLAGIGERLARAVHATYLEQRKQGPTDQDDPALADWRDLHEEYRVSSRAQAAHLGVKLQAIGCGLAPLAQWDAPQASLTDAEVELLAILEHERWVVERTAAGWRPGPRDPEAKTSPYLVPWDELTGEDGERVRDLDRAGALAIPALVVRAGCRLVRTPDAASPQHTPRDGGQDR